MRSECRFIFKVFGEEIKRVEQSPAGITVLRWEFLGKGYRTLSKTVSGGEEGSREEKRMLK